ncbi:hypothetical protein BRARA_F03370 [Brassica rapa]|uniref:Uncharacterized protein n=1 Tax=Brassica campestris TaxID=3711 RepID=A0A397ZD48_BRACM|nr:hypothetical protein BRARA_F03370 [Brassica rapa]
MKSEQTVTPVTAAVNGGLAGAMYGGIAGMVIPPLFRRLYRVLTPLSQAQLGLGIRCWVGNLAYSFVRQGLKLKPAHALSCAAGCAVLSGTECKMNEIFSATSERSTRGKAFDN